MSRDERTTLQQLEALARKYRIRFRDRTGRAEWCRRFEREIGGPDAFLTLHCEASMRNPDNMEPQMDKWLANPNEAKQLLRDLRDTSAEKPKLGVNQTLQDAAEERAAYLAHMDRKDPVEVCVAVSDVYGVAVEADALAGYVEKFFGEDAARQLVERLDIKTRDAKRAAFIKACKSSDKRREAG